MHATTPNQSAARFATPIDDLGANFARAFDGPRFLLVSAAVASTAALAPSGGDHAVRVFFQTHGERGVFSESMVVAGYVGPVVIAGGIYAGGLLSRDKRLASAGAAAVQALALTFATTTLLKVVTGRPFPSHGGNPADPARLGHPEYATEFNLFQPDKGWAWPSGHTACAVAVAAALTAHEPRSIWVPLLGYVSSTAIGIGMLAGDHHWASDVLGGAFLGQAIGNAVGSSFREQHERAERREGASFLVLPMFGASRGLVVTGAW